MKIPSASSELYVAALMDAIGEREGQCAGVDLQAVNASFRPWLDAGRQAIQPKEAVENDHSLLLAPMALSHKKATQPFYLRPEELSLARNSMFPNLHREPEVPDLRAAFLQAMRELHDPVQLLPLMEHYLHAVPSAIRGISAYDYARMRAAASICLHADHPKTLPSLDKTRFLLLKGDLSGIQSYIFDVVSKGAAQSLKSRSFRIQVLIRLVIAYLLKELKLTPAHVLLEGGGNCYLLLPGSAAAKLEAIAAHIQQELLTEEIDFHLGWMEIRGSELGENFGFYWEEVDRHLGIRRLQAGKGLSKESLFRPFVAGDALPKTVREREASRFKQKTRRLNASIGYQITPSEEVGNPFSLFDHTLHLIDEAGFAEVKEEVRHTLTHFNPISTANHPFSFVVKDLPVWDEEGELLQTYAKEIRQSRKMLKETLSEEEQVHGPQVNELIEFGYLSLFAKHRTGTDKLGILKADIDSLGLFFREGVQDGYQSLAHTAGISRALRWFFEGYMNTLLDQPMQPVLSWVWLDGKTPRTADSYHQKLTETERFRDNIYVIFSGGDDFFLVGAWDVVVEFAWILYEEFRAFTRSALTLSAGVVMVSPTYPVSRFAEHVEEALDAAKHRNLLEKNRISIFEEVLTWKEYGDALNLRNVLVDLLMKPAPHAESRRLLHKVQRSMEMMRSMQNQIRRRRTMPLRQLWRLMYILRDVKKVNQQIVEEHLIRPFERQIQEVLTKGHEFNPAYISVGVRMAEFLTRNITRQTNDTRAATRSV